MTAEARELQAKRLGLTEFATKKFSRKKFDEAKTELRSSSPGWPPAAQYLHKSDVGAITAAWRRLVPILMHYGEEVGHIVAIVERKVAAFAAMRTHAQTGRYRRQEKGRNQGRTRVAL
jgi:protein-L-isoaspartate O-methyltransferase